MFVMFDVKINISAASYSKKLKIPIVSRCNNNSDGSADRWFIKWKPMLAGDDSFPSK